MKEWDIIYRVVGMKRSGHHAIIMWMVKNMDGNIYHINNVNNPDVADNLKKITELKKDGGKNILFYSIEDYDPDKDFKINFNTVTTDICVLRDPLNIFASRIKVSKTNEHKNKDWFSENKINLYKKHFNLLNNDNFKVINYSKWNFDDDYRKELSSDFNLKDSENFEEISFLGHNYPYTHASSFNDVKDEITNVKFNKRHETLTKKEKDIITIGVGNEIITYFSKFI